MTSEAAPAPIGRPPGGWWQAPLAAAAAVVLANAPLAAPFPGALLRVFAPLPLLWLVARGRSGTALAGGAAVIALPALAAGHDAALDVAVPFGPLALLLGRGLAAGWTVDRTVLGASAASLLLGLALLAARGIDPLAAAQTEARGIGGVLAEALSRASGEPVDAAALSAVVLRLMPALAVVQAAASAWLNLLALRRLGLAEGAGGRPPLDDWSEWRAPEPLVFALIAGAVALLPGAPALTTVGVNVLVVVGFVYVLQGLAVIGFFFRSRRVPLPARIAGYTLISLQLALHAAVGIVGLADLWVDFRGRARRKG